MVLLMGAALDPDPASFFRAHYADVHRFVAASTGASEADVEDIVQDALLRAWRDRAGFRGESSALTWILSIARTRALDFRRRDLQRRRHAEVLQAITRLETALVPADLLEDAELKTRVHDAINALPADYADLLLRRYQEGRSVRAIADDLDESEDAVESRLRRARAAFRDRLNDGASRHE
jgi:RNA polymerase sigma-70 factor (ECF subfamily)